MFLHVKIPECISALFNEPVIHDKVVEKSGIEAEIFEFLNLTCKKELA